MNLLNVWKRSQSISETEDCSCFISLPYFRVISNYSEPSMILFGIHNTLLSLRVRSGPLPLPLLGK